MLSFSVFVNFIKAPMLKELFVRFDQYFEDIKWGQPTEVLIVSLQKKINSLPVSARENVKNSIDRIQQLTDEDSQKLFLLSISNRYYLNSLRSALERSCWIYLNHIDIFESTEKISYANRYRYSLHWNSYYVNSAIPMNPLCKVGINEFKELIGYTLNISKESISFFFLEKLTHDFYGKETKMFQFDIYFPKLSEKYFLMNDDTDESFICSSQLLSPCSIIYTESTGIIEVVSESDSLRFFFANSFSEVFLKKQDINLKKITLSPLLKKSNLSWEVSDGIKSVSFRSMVFGDNRLYSRIKIDFPLNSGSDVRGYIRDSFKKNTVLSHEMLTLTQVTLSIEFDDEKTLPITLKLPNKCDLRNRTEKEQRLGEKYLTRWGLLAGISDDS